MAYKDLTDPRNKAAKLKHYYNNKEQYYERNRQKKTELKLFIREQKNVPCTDCGQRYPFYVMQFDHLRDKEYTIARLVNLGNMQKIIDEIAKCEVVCANCHAVRTYSRLGIE